MVFCVEVNGWMCEQTRAHRSNWGSNSEPLEWEYSFTLLINWWKLKNFNSFTVLCSATFQSVKCISLRYRILLCFALKYWDCSTKECYFALHWSTWSVQFLRCPTSEPEINTRCALQKPGIEMAASAWQILGDFLCGFGHISCTVRANVVYFRAEGLNMSASWVTTMAEHENTSKSSSVSLNNYVTIFCLHYRYNV
jgi:hypothetical protein